ncbi:MAG: hypothetical protein VW338_03435 [Rhodospirillaceae bacterium]
MLINHMVGHWANAEGGIGTPTGSKYQWHFQDPNRMRHDAIQGLVLGGGFGEGNFWPYGRAGACAKVFASSVGTTMMLSTIPLTEQTWSMRMWFKAEGLTTSTELMLARFASNDGALLDVNLVDAVAEDGRWNVQVNWQNAAGGAGGGIDLLGLEGEWSCLALSCVGGSNVLALLDSGDAGDPQIGTSTSNVPNSSFYFRHLLDSQVDTGDETIFVDDIMIWRRESMDQTFMEYLADGYFWNTWDSTKPLNTWQQFTL